METGARSGTDIYRTVTGQSQDSQADVATKLVASKLVDIRSRCVCVCDLGFERGKSKEERGKRLMKRTELH